MTTHDKQAAFAVPAASRSPVKRYEFGALVQRVLLTGSAALAFAHAPQPLAARLEALRTWLANGLARVEVVATWEFVVAGAIFGVVLLGPAIVAYLRGRWRGVVFELMSAGYGVAAFVSLVYGCGWPWSLGLALASALVWPWPYRVVHAARAIEAPITKVGEDQLHRARIVEKIVAHLSVPSVRCPRVAVVGAVGSGKTSVANLAVERLEAEGHTVVRFDPWHHASLANSRGALLLTVNDGITTLRRGKGLFVRPRVLARRLWGKLVDQIGWIDLLDDEIERRLELGKDELSAALDAALKPGKRIVVVIDDLERCAPDVAVDLLMNIKEIVDASTLGYLLAFDKQALLERLEKAGHAFPNDPGHLDKVIDLQLELPRPSHDDLGRIRRTFLAEIDPEGRVTPAMLEAIEDLLPETLREQKRFLLFAAASLARLPERPKWVELDDGFLGVLLLHEYLDAGFIEQTLADPDGIADLDSGLAREEIRSALQSREPSSDPDPQGEEPAEPLPSVYARAREVGGRIRSAVHHLRWLNGERGLPHEERVHRLASSLQTEASAAECLAGYQDATDDELDVDLGAIVEVRRRLFDFTAETFMRSEQDLAFGLLSKSHEVRRMLVEELRKRSLAASTTHLESSLGLLWRWIGMGGLYTAHVRDDALFVVNICRGAGDCSLAYLEVLDRRIDAELAGNGLPQLYAALRALLVDNVAKELDALFDKPRGIEVLTRGWSKNAQARILAGVTSGFLTPERQTRLMALAAAPNVEVQTNLLWFVRLLAWINKDNGCSFAHLGQFVGAIWKGVTERPLNRRTLGELGRYRSQFIAWGVPEAALPQPEWATQELASHDTIVDLNAVLREHGLSVADSANDDHA